VELNMPNSGARFVLTSLILLSFSAMGEKPSWSYTLEETLKVVNSQLLNKFVTCEYVSEEIQRKAALALQAEQVKICGETQAKNRGDYKKPEELERTACNSKVKENFDFRPYFNGLRLSPEASFFVKSQQNLVGRIASEEVYFRTIGGSSPRAQMTVEQNNLVSITMYYDLEGAFGSDTLKFDPHSVVTNPLNFPASYITVFHAKSAGSSTGIAGQKVAVHQHQLTCKVRSNE